MTGSAFILADAEETLLKVLEAPFVAQLYADPA